MPEVNNLEACTYCSCLFQIPKVENGHYCLNRSSPYWVESFKLPDKELTQEQRLRGCEGIKFNGTKIPEEIFQQLPADSYLRKLPLEEVVLKSGESI